MELTPFIMKDAHADPIYLQLYRYLRHEIESGRLQTGTKLPSIRSFAALLQINKNTVVNSYEQLQAEGYIFSLEKRGWYVCNIDVRPQVSNVFAEYSGEPAAVHQGESIAQSLNHAPRYDFRYGQVDMESFPRALWRKLSSQTLMQDTPDFSYYGDPNGEPGLREQIVAYLYQSRGVRCDVTQVIVGSGIQNLLSMLTRFLSRNQKQIAFEEPGYDGARVVFENEGYKIIPIPLNDDGIDISELRKCGAQRVYVTPAHQFPCGMILPIAKRLQLLQWAKDVDGLIVEDDYDGEFRFHGNTIPSLQGMDTHGRVIYLGTFSKSLLPAFRTAYMVLPHRLLEAWNQMFARYQSNVSRFHQETLKMFMRDGHWYRHLRKMRMIYARKQEKLLQALNTYMPDKVHIEGAGAGLHILIKVPGFLGEEAEFISEARRMGLGIYSDARHWVDANRRQDATFLIGFGGIREGDIEAGVRLMASIMR